MLHQIKEEIKLNIRARYPVLYVVSSEEERVERLIADIGSELRRNVYFWSCTDGFQGVAETQLAMPALNFVADSGDRGIFVLKDFHTMFDEPKVVRRVRDLIVNMRRNMKTLVFFSPIVKIPPEFERDVVIFDIPLPDSAELLVILKNFLASMSKSPDVKILVTPPMLERVVNAVLGLTENQALNVFAKVVVADQKFSEEDLPLMINEKRQIIRKAGLLEFYEPGCGIGDVGGLANLKRWLTERAGAFGAEARAYGLPEPKGLLLLGVQGCGKSLTAKAIADLWKLPLLRLDVGSLFGQYIGMSEENMRRAIKIAESLAPTILWLDEIEKGLSGMKGGGGGDGGTTARVFSTFLTWLQEKTKPVFVVATANNIADLPPELLRKGRFDEIFFIDLPSEAERKKIFEIHLVKRKRNPAKFELDKLAAAATEYSGAEIEQAIVSAMYGGFVDKKREINSEDILKAIRESVPLSTTMKEAIAELRNWCTQRARPAS
ncbi:MAG: AAA family ATPase [Planctomycetota bacterium]|nr:AAA family ATPase [Planctomycetota bacterium]